MALFDEIMPPAMRGATAGTAGGKGLVPKPAAGDQAKMLLGDGTWAAQPTGTVPNQTGHNGKLLTTDGTTAAWTAAINSTSIGASSPSTGAFTSLSSSGAATLGGAVISASTATGFNTLIASSGITTGRGVHTITNSGGHLNIGLEASVGGTTLTNSTAYSSYIGTFTSTPLHLVSNSLIKGTLTSTGNLLIGTTDESTMSGAGGLKIASTTAASTTTSGALQVAGGVGIAGAIYSSGERILNSLAQNGATRIQARNDTSGGSAQSQVSATIGDFTTYTAMGATSAGFTPGGLFAANAGYIASNASAGLNVFTVDSTPLIIGTNNTARITIAAAGAVTLAGNLTVSGAGGITAQSYSLSVDSQGSMINSVGNDIYFDINQGNLRIRPKNGVGNVFIQNSASLSITGGNLTVSGSLSKGSGSFRIDHPLPTKTATHRLVHSFIEGPKADLIYRGKVTLVNGAATVNIDEVATMTAGTFVVLCRDVQCYTSNESDWSAVRGSVTGNILTIQSEDAASTANVSWLVIGERQDPHIMETDWTDDNGKVIVEPLKEIVPEVAPIETPV